MKATVNSAIFNYSAYFEKFPGIRAVGTIDAKSFDDAKDAVHGMAGKWITEEGSSFVAGRPSVVDIWWVE